MTTVEIKTPFTHATYDIKDLTSIERTALAQILGLSGARRQAFQVMRGWPKFQKVSKYEVWKACPQGASGFATEVSVNILKDQEYISYDTAPGRVKEAIKELLPEATVSFATHTVSGFCPRCQTTHSVMKRSVKVCVEVGGIPFSQLFAV